MNTDYTFALFRGGAGSGAALTTLCAKQVKSVLYQEYLSRWVDNVIWSWIFIS